MSNTTISTPASFQMQLQPPSEIITVLSVGQGPSGPKGDKGDSRVPCEYHQKDPASNWTVNHNLGFYPSVFVFSVGGVQLMAEIIHVSKNQIMIYFDSPMIGFVSYF